MKMRTMLAGMAALAISAVSVAALPASAAEKAIAYTDGGTASMGTDNDGVSLRKNIYNQWGNNVADIASANPVNGYISVEFTVSGLGDRSTNLDDSGNATDAYFVYLAGSVGSNQSWNKAEDSAPCEHVAINGDGTYTVKWTLNEGSDTIDCLILQSNINLYNFEGATAENFGNVNFTINSIKTDDGVEATTTTEDPNGGTTTTTTTTTTGNGTTTTTTTTTTGKGGTTTTTAAASTTNTATGDASGVGVAAVAVVLAGGVALVSRKRG